MPEKPLETSEAQTRERLLQAAGQVFAEQGFKAARVRDICERAGANIAAVNYYFGDKARLYSAVLRHAAQIVQQEHPFNAGLGTDATPQERLEAFIRGYLERVFDQGQVSWYGKVLSRETMEPTEALDQMINEAIRPAADMLYAIVRDLAAGQLSEQQVRNCVNSIVGQCLFYRHARSVLLRMCPEHERIEIPALAAHITRFSLAGIQQLRSRAGTEAQREILQEKA